MYFYLDEDYQYMKERDWTADYVDSILDGYCFYYGLTSNEVEKVLSIYGVSELFDGIPMACEEFSELLDRGSDQPYIYAKGM